MVSLASFTVQRRLTIGILKNHLEPFHLATLFTLTKAWRVDPRTENIQNLLAETKTALIDRRPDGRWRRVCNRVVDLIRSVSHIAQNRIRLLDQIDLETNVIHDIRSLPWDRYNCDEVDEWDTASPIIDQRCLTLFTSIEHSLEMGDSDVIGILSLGALDDFSLGT